MMGIRRIVSAVALSAALALGTLTATPAQAQGPGTGLPFITGIQVQNLASVQATVSFAFYAEGGTNAVGTIPNVPIPANGQVTYAQLPSTAVQPGFRGSAVISSDQRIAAIVNVVSPDYSFNFGGEAYVGVTGGSTTVSLPLLFKGFFGFNTFVTVQNVSQTPANVTINYVGRDGNNNPVTASQTINNVQPNASVRFDQQAFGGLPIGFNGSATITSNTEIAAVVTQVGPTTVLIYNGFTEGTPNPIFPLVNTNNSGFQTGIALQNRGTTATNVTVTYTPSAAGTSCTETKSIAPGATEYFAIDSFRITQPGENCANGALFVGSGRVTANSANQPLVAIVNQLNSGTNRGGSYSSLNANNATATVVYPLIQDRVGGFFTGISLINVGDVATTITCTYRGTANNQPVTTTQTSGTLQPGGTYTPVQVNQIAPGFNGSGVCTAANSSARILGVANQLRNTGTTDTFFVYEGTNS
jgi:hypothetical protein